MSTHRHSMETRLGCVLLGGGALMIAFWTLYLTGLVELGQQDPLVSAFETSFLLADTLLGVLLLFGGFQLLRSRPSGPYLLTVVAAMSVYLGLLDLVFYAQAGLWDSFSAAAAFELTLISVCILGGSTCLVLGWRLWTEGGQ